MTRKLIYSSILAILLLSGCGGDSSSNDTKTDEPSNQNGEVTNKAPIVNAGADKTVTVNETITITGSASDSDGTLSSIEWKKGSEVLATTLSFSYTATTVGTDVLTLTVIDDDGKSNSDSLNIVVDNNSELTEQG